MDTGGSELRPEAVEKDNSGILQNKKTGTVALPDRKKQQGSQVASLYESGGPAGQGVLARKLPLLLSPTHKQPDTTRAKILITQIGTFVLFD